MIYSKILGLILRHFLQFSHLALHINEKGELLNNLADIILVNTK